jgi:hypothetical protein
MEADFESIVDQAFMAAKAKLTLIDLDRDVLTLCILTVVRPYSYGRL